MFQLLRQNMGKIAHNSRYHYYQADQNNPKSPSLHVVAIVPLSFSWSRLFQSSEDREAAERHHRNAHKVEAQCQAKHLRFKPKITRAECKTHQPDNTATGHPVPKSFVPEKYHRVNHRYVTLHTDTALERWNIEPEE